MYSSKILKSKREKLLVGKLSNNQDERVSLVWVPSRQVKEEGNEKIGNWDWGI